MNLAHVILRQWRQRPARTILSLLSVSIAVAAVLAAALSRASVRQESAGLSRLVIGRARLDVVSSTSGRLHPNDLPDLSRVPHVVASFPLVSRGTLARVHGQRLRTVVVGLPLESEPAWAGLPLVEGRRCDAPGEALIASEVARSMSVKLGDRLTVLTRRGPRSATVVGITAASGLGDLAPGATLALPLATVQNWFGLDEQVDRWRLLIEDDQLSVARSEIAGRLPASLMLESPAAQGSLADSVLRSTELALGFSGALTLAMAAFIVLNTLRMNFGERRRDMATIRLLGATSAQVVSLHLIEGAALGCVGSLLGIPFGILLGRGLSSVMQQLLEAEVSTPPLPPSLVLGTIALGTLVAALAAVIPAWQARHVSAQESLAEAELRRPERPNIWLLLGGAAGLIAALAVLVLVLLHRVRPEAAIPVGLVMLVAFLAVLPVLLRPIVRATSWLLPGSLRLEGQLAADQLLQRPVRAGLSAGVLVVALGTTVGLGHAIINNVADVNRWHRRSLAADVAVSDLSVLESAAAVGHAPDGRPDWLPWDEIASVVELRFFSARANGVPVTCILRDFLPDPELPWSLVAGDEKTARAALLAGDAVVGGVLAKRLQLKLGQPLRLEVGGRALSLSTAAAANDYMLGGMVVYLDRAAAAKLIDAGPAAMYLIRAAPGVPAEELISKVQQASGDRHLSVQSFSELHRELDRLIGGILAALWGLLAVGFVVGGVAVANTLAMNVVEQTRELGLLRVVGMTGRQVQKLLFCQSLLLGVLGTLLGLVCGGVTALVIHLGHEPLLGYSIPFALHPVLIATSAAGCLLVTLLAGWTPGVRAARLDLLAAIAYE